jgi:general secretion pathway protein B
MSSILKALRKLEEQQAARRGETSHAARRAPVPGSRWRAPTAILASVVLAVAGTVTVMNSLSPRTAPETAAPAPQRQETAAPGSTVGLPEPVLPAEPVTTPPAVTDRETVAAPAPIEEQVAVRVAAPRSAPAGRSRTAPAMPSLQEPETAAPFSAAARTTSTQASSRSHLQPETRPVDRALAPPPPPPSIAVTGIAWQKGESDRIAMVNGSPVSEGTVVAGARVVEIKPDRVRFSRDGAEFEVPIGTGGAER